MKLSNESVVVELKNSTVVQAGQDPKVQDSETLYLMSQFSLNFQ